MEEVYLYTVRTCNCWQVTFLFAARCVAQFCLVRKSEDDHTRSVSRSSFLVQFRMMKLYCVNMIAAACFVVLRYTWVKKKSWKKNDHSIIMPRAAPAATSEARRPVSASNLANYNLDACISVETCVVLDGCLGVVVSDQDTGNSSVSRLDCKMQCSIAILMLHENKGGKKIMSKNAIHHFERSHRHQPPRARKQRHNVHLTPQNGWLEVRTDRAEIHQRPHQLAA